jgi:carboxyl-terminal processing protease
MRFATTFKLLIAMGTGLILAACGGGGGNTSPSPTPAPSPSASTWQAGVFPDMSLLEARCAAPRTGADPFNSNQPYPDMAGSATQEKMWLRSWSHEYYLWYDEIIDRNPRPYGVVEYFDLLRTEEQTSSGVDKDNFHFSMDTQEWNELSQTGSIGSGYGMNLILFQEPFQDREVLVAYIEPNSPADLAGISRGTRILEIDGVDITDNTTSGVATLNAGLFPEEDGESHDFVFQTLEPVDPISTTLVSADITTEPVQQVKTFTNESTTVGYMLFNDHIATAETGLKDAFEQLEAENVDELILDLRYNGGGYLAIAAQVGYMIAGDAATAGRTFQLQQFNDKYSTVHPFTGQTIEPVPFIDETIGFSETAGQALPTLNLDRVFVISTASTCSASEAIINGLRGVGVEVILIGDTTCGKPYGFYATDNCGETYFTIQFQGVNNNYFGDYAGGFVPSLSDNDQDFVLGCSAEDDLDSPFDLSEDSIATALTYVRNNACTGAGFTKNGAQRKSQTVPRLNYELLGRSPARRVMLLNKTF